MQDIRLGGLICRLKNCRELLLSYTKGEIPEIEELREGVLPMDDTYITSWEDMVSANIL